MKYLKHYESNFGEKTVSYYQPEGTYICIPESADNSDYVRMMAEVDAGTSTIEEGNTIVRFE